MFKKVVLTAALVLIVTATPVVAMMGGSGAHGNDGCGQGNSMQGNMNDMNDMMPAYPVSSQAINSGFNYYTNFITPIFLDVATFLYTTPRKRELVLLLQSPKRYQMLP